MPSCADGRSRFAHRRCRRGRSCVPDKSPVPPRPSRLAMLRKLDIRHARDADIHCASDDMSRVERSTFGEPCSFSASDSRSECEAVRSTPVRASHVCTPHNTSSKPWFIGNTRSACSVAQQPANIQILIAVIAGVRRPVGSLQPLVAATPAAATDGRSAKLRADVLRVLSGLSRRSCLQHWRTQMLEPAAKSNRPAGLRETRRTSC